MKSAILSLALAVVAGTNTEACALQWVEQCMSSTDAGRFRSPPERLCSTGRAPFWPCYYHLNLFSSATCPILAASCNACTKGLSADCSLPLQVVIDKEVCSQAPFTTSTEECINAASAACAASTDTTADCQSCILKNAINLKNSNCTLVEVAALGAFCETIPSNFTAPV
jgi:hypothetical protein